MNRYLKINDYVFTFEDFLTTKYTLIANSIVNSRITPTAIEASVFALLTGMINFGKLFANLHGNLWAYILGIDENNLDLLYIAMIIKALLSLLPMLLLFMVPNKEEIEADEDLKKLNKEL